MDFDKLIDEITEKVLKEINRQEPDDCGKPEDKPKLLLLSQKYNNSCHRLLESGKLGELYSIDCAHQCKWEVSSSDYEAVVLFDLTCDVMVKIAAGFADTEYTRLASEAILSGKRIYVPKGEIQLFRYRDTAPGAYYSMMLEKLNMLAEYGAIFCDSDRLEDKILGTMTYRDSTDNKTADSRMLSGAGDGKQMRLDKKVITEIDIRTASTDGAACILVNAGAIITDLALDYARDCGLCIQKK